MNKESQQTADKSRRSLLISADDLAVLIGVSTRTVWRLLSSGRLIEPVRLGGNVRWNRERIEEWIREGCPTPTKATVTKRTAGSEE
jgi:excisionase family DNA binding protein